MLFGFHEVQIRLCVSRRVFSPSCCMEWSKWRLCSEFPSLRIFAGTFYILSFCFGQVRGVHIANIVAPAIFGERGILEPGTPSAATARRESGVGSRNGEG